MRGIAVILAVSLWLASTVAAQVPEAQPAPPAPAIPAPVDTPYPGIISLRVDATDLDHRVFNVQEQVPVKAGPLILLYPEWLPGTHAVNGRVDRLAGLTMTVNGKPVPWTRDPSNVFAFHVDVPAGVEALDLKFQFLTPTTPNGQGRVTMSNDLMDLEWNDTVLYPAGQFARQITVAAEVRVPAGWAIGTALEAAISDNAVTTFKPVSLDTLVDSPVFAGRNALKIDLDPNGRSRVTLDIFADQSDALPSKPEHIEVHRALVRQADRLFGARHFDHYDMLFMLTDKVGGVGLEHHRSSENGTDAKYFTDWDKSPAGRDLLAHEFTHSWNGKFRRPADLWTPDFNVPMRDSLLWVYEGQTQYWGYVLAARAGLLSRQNVLDALAGIAATYDSRPGRSWKNLQDTTNDPISANRRPQPWTSWQRSEDYYNEGLLMWLDADTLIRERSFGKKSLDDFAHAFFGIEDGRWTPVTYTFDDVVKALNAVQPYDWAGFLRQRLDSHGPGAPLDGLARGGYRLVFTEKPSDYARSIETRTKMTDLTFSLGAVLRADGEIASVVWDGPAFAAGLSGGVRIIAVNGIAYDADRFKDAIKARTPIDLLIRSGDRFKTITLPNKDGLRYPKLEKIGKDSARLDEILTPRK